MRRFVAATAVTAALVTGGGVAFAASQGVQHPTTTGSEAVTSTTVVGKGRPARPRADRVKNVLDALVKDGTITQSQEDKILARLEAAGPPGPMAGLGGRRLLGIAGQGLDVAAKTIGVSRADLLTALRGGKSIAEVAAAHGVDRAKVVSALVDAADAEIQKAVDAGKLTPEQAAKLRGSVQAGVEKLVDAKGLGMGMPGHGGWRGPRGPRGGMGPGGAPAAGPDTGPSTTVPPTTSAPSTSAAPSTTTAPSVSTTAPPSTT